MVVVVDDENKEYFIKVGGWKLEENGYLRIYDSSQVVIAIFQKWIYFRVDED